MKSNQKELKMDTLATFGNSLYSGLNSASRGMSNLIQQGALFSMEAEKYLNIAGEIPFVGSYSAALLRTPLTATQLASSAISLLLTGGSAIANYFVEKTADLSQHLLQAEIALRMGGNGLLNGSRAVFEVVPVLGTLVLLPIDLIKYASSFEFINYLPKGGLQVFG